MKSNHFKTNPEFELDEITIALNRPVEQEID